MDSATIPTTNAVAIGTRVIAVEIPGKRSNTSTAATAIASTQTSRACAQEFADPTPMLGTGSVTTTTTTVVVTGTMVIAAEIQEKANNSTGAKSVNALIHFNKSP